MIADHPITVFCGATGFTFLTWFMWPVWISVCVYVLEPNASRRKPWFRALALLGLMFGLLLYVPHGITRDTVVVDINNQSLHRIHNVNPCGPGDGEWQARQHGTRGPPWMVQGASGHEHGHVGNPRRGIYPQQRW